MEWSRVDELELTISVTSPPLTNAEQKAFDAMIEAGYVSPDSDPHDFFLRVQMMHPQGDADRVVAEKIRSIRMEKQELAPHYGRKYVSRCIEQLLRLEGFAPSSGITHHALRRIEQDAQSIHYPAALLLARLWNVPPDHFSPFSFRYEKGQYVRRQ